MNIQTTASIPTASIPTPSSTHQRECRLCGRPLAHSFVDLGTTPLCESFIAPEHIDAMEPTYPLHAFVCDRCFLVQVPQYVSPKDIFEEYAYFSSYSTSWVAHAKTYCRTIAQRLGLGADSLVVELASNDGYLLQHFRPLGIPVLGIEPAANVARAAIDRGIPTRIEFFGRALAEELRLEGRQADLIIGNNVLAQVPDLNDFVAGMALLLKAGGMITLEFPHLHRLIVGNQFDTIYHEHFSYFSLITVQELAARHGLAVVDVEELPTHGGSLRVYLAHREAGRDIGARVEELLAAETMWGYRDLSTYAAFSDQVAATKRRLLSFLIAAKDQGKRICGYGAPGKGNTLLNYCGIGTDILDFTVDRNPYKHGRFTPGRHIPVLPIEAIDEARPDLILILPWNLESEIVHQMRRVADWGAKFVVAIPSVKIIDPREMPR